MEINMKVLKERGREKEGRKGERKGGREGWGRKERRKTKLEVHDVLAIITPGTSPKSPYQRDSYISISL